MYRNVYLLGELGEKFGDSFRVYAKTLQEAVKIISANRDGFDVFIGQCIEKNLGLSVSIEGEEIASSEDEIDNLLVPLKEGDITLALTPAGAGGDNPIVNIIIGAILFMTNPALGAEYTKMQKFIHTAVNTVAASLVSTGIAQLLAPDPADDGDEPTNYLFNGDAQNIVEGDPVPVLYGELRIPGSPISMTSLTNFSMGDLKHVIDSDGNIFLR